MSNLERVQAALEAATELEQARLELGLDHVDIYVSDVEGDWLEEWGEEEEL